MAVTIRLTRMGAKKKPFYRIVAADSRFSRDGRFLEVLGTYDPNPNPPAIKFNQELVAGWLKKGANPTTTVKNLMKKAGLSVSRSEKPETAAKAELILLARVCRYAFFMDMNRLSPGRGSTARRGGE